MFCRVDFNWVCTKAVRPRRTAVQEQRLEGRHHTPALSLHCQTIKEPQWKVCVDLSNIQEHAALQ